MPEFDPEGSGYDYDTATKSGGKPDETGHWGSLDPRTGMVLKGRNHSTWNLMEEEEIRRGNQIIKKGSRYYSVKMPKFWEKDKVKNNWYSGDAVAAEDGDNVPEYDLTVYEPREKLRGIYDQFAKMDEALGDGDFRNLMPFEQKYKTGRIVNFTPEVSDRKTNALYFSIMFDKEPEAVDQFLDEIAKQKWGRDMSQSEIKNAIMSENAENRREFYKTEFEPVSLFGKAFLNSLANKPAMAARGTQVYTPGKMFGYDNILQKTSEMLEGLKNEQYEKEVTEAAEGRLWPAYKGRWWDIKPELLPETVNAWSANVGDQIPLMLMTLMGREAGKVGGKMLGPAIGGLWALVTGGPEPTDVVTAPVIAKVTESVMKHLGGASPLVAMEAGNFMDSANAIGLDNDISEKYARQYGIGSGLIEYAQWLWNLNAFRRLDPALKKTLLRRALVEIGGASWEGFEEIGQQGLQNKLLQRAIDEQKARTPGYNVKKPDTWSGSARSFSVALGVSLVTRMPGHAFNAVRKSQLSNKIIENTDATEREADTAVEVISQGGQLAEEVKKTVKEQVKAATEAEKPPTPAAVSGKVPQAAAIPPEGLTERPTKPTPEITPKTPLWEIGQERPFKFDENSTKNEGRFRLYPPEEIDPDSYRSQTAIKSRDIPRTEGVRFILGKTKEGKSVIQTIRFNKNIMPEDKAVQWWEENKSKFEFYQALPAEPKGGEITARNDLQAIEQISKIWKNPQKIDSLTLGDIAYNERLSESVRRVAKAAQIQLDRTLYGREPLTADKLAAVAGIEDLPAAIEDLRKTVISKEVPKKQLPSTEQPPAPQGKQAETQAKELAKGETEAEQDNIKKLHQQIHAVAAVKGLTKKALTALKKKHTGYNKLTGKIASKKITQKQLQNLLTAVQKARPSRIGYKRVITQKTENKIQSLKQSLQQKLQMTDEAYKNILQTETYGKEPKYISAESFITETQGKEIIRRMLDAAEVLRVVEPYRQAVTGNAEIAEQVKNIESRIDKKRKRDPYSLESMRYYAQQAEIKTGAPIYSMYNELIDTHLETSTTRTAEMHKLEAKVGRDAFKAIAKDENALKKVADYIASKSNLANKPKAPSDISEEELKLAHAIEDILETYQWKARTAKFFNYYYYNQPIPDADKYKRQITKAVDIYEGQGKDALIKYLKTQKWGVIHSGYEPLEVLIRKIRPYTTGPTAVGKGHIKIRTDIQYHGQERNILQRLSAYMRQMDMLYNLSPKINAFVRLFDDNFDKFDNPQVVQENIELFLRNLKRYNIQGGLFERMIARAYSQAMRTIIMPSPVLAFRNLFQNLAFEHDKSILIDPRNEHLTADEMAYFETYIQQYRSMVEEYFMVGEKPPLGLRTVSALVDKIKIYPYSDIANRHWGYWAKINQVKRVLDLPADEMMEAAKFDDMTLLEQKTALGILAKDGGEAMARYVARVHVDDIHFLYERAQRSPAEMSPLGRVMGNLMLFPRAYGEKLAHAIGKVVNTNASMTERYRNLKIVFSVIAGGMICGSIFQMVTGRRKNPYDPFEVLSYEAGGLTFGAIKSLSEVYANLLLASKGDKRAYSTLTVALPEAADMFIPFYDYVLRAIEASTDSKNIDREALRGIREMIDSEYRRRGGAYKLHRTAVEKWQYFLAGSSVDKKIEERKKLRRLK